MNTENLNQDISDKVSEEKISQTDEKVIAILTGWYLDLEHADLSVEKAREEAIKYFETLFKRPYARA